MSANLLPQMPATNSKQSTISDWLLGATNKLKKADFDTPRLDAEIILANTLALDRIFLHSHPEQIIYSSKLKIANLHLKKRLKHLPIAYIIGKKEFYGRNFKVTPDVLIPRPESEEIISTLSNILLVILPQDLANNKLPVINLIDVGTGSGCLGITAKLEFPSLDVTLADISKKALNIATSNARALAADVKCLRSDLLSMYVPEIDIITANLPYVDKSWECSPETAYEPRNALFANDSGEALIKRLIIQSSQKLSKNGYLIIEADPRQHKSLINFATNYSFALFDKSRFSIAFKIKK